MPDTFPFRRFGSSSGSNRANGVQGGAERMVRHMRSSDRMTCGARGFACGNGGSIPGRGVCGKSRCAGGAHADFSCRPSLCHFDGVAWPIIAGMVFFE